MIEFLKSPELSCAVFALILIVGILSIRGRTKTAYVKPYAEVSKPGVIMVTGNVTKLQKAITSPVDRWERLESDVWYVYLRTDNIETTKAVASQINSED